MNKDIKNIAIFGSTGSIGVNSINVIRNFPDKFKIRCISANSNCKLLIEQAKDIRPEFVIITDEKYYPELKKELNGIEVLCGRNSFRNVLESRKIDILINSLVGFSGLEPTITAIKNKVTIALANKESLVTGGEIINKYLQEYGVDLLPIDSEHSAILQCLTGERYEDISKLILTASGGPFLHRQKDEFNKITVAEALNHPNWKMGNKITIDSATLMNKGLEVIEAKWLFNIPVKKIDVVIHPQSIIHSMVEFVDGSIKAQMGVPDMKIPIQYALTYPFRLVSSNTRLNFTKIKDLQFFQPDLDKFTCLKLAFDVLASGGSAPATMNAANEVAVDLFLKEKIRFSEIPVIIEETLNATENKTINEFEDILETDRLVRERLSLKYS